MPLYEAPLRDMRFVMMELFGTDAIRRLPGCEEVSDDLITAIMNESAKFCQNVLLPLNRTGDEEGCTHHGNGVVTTPKGFKEAYQQYVENGWAGLSCDPKYGGQGLPEVVTLFLEEMVCSTNLSFGLYPGLTRGAIQLLSTHGSDALKDFYLPRMISGVWSGTMCLTEPHCGTDLGLIRTKAVPQEDGSYRLTGTKIFISSGEHDLTENIVHFVLARTPGGPAGIKGISLFLVPKFMPNPDGTLGERNGVTCASIEHKMGIKASATCVMNFDDAKGFLVGELHHGVSSMFVMMNSERLAVGSQGLGISEISYQNALAYAKDRLQSRALRGTKHPEKPADPILVHADVRKMLLTMKALTEGCRMLSFWIAFQNDTSHRATDAEERQNADDLMQLMTPIVKAFLTDVGFQVANIGVQVYGGHGYIREWGMEQYARDVRIAQIYEGTNGIQAMDFVGRKIPAAAGRYLRQYFHPMLKFIEEHENHPDLKDMIPALSKAVNRLQQITLLVAGRSMGNPDEAGAAATDLLRAYAIVTLAYLWARAAKVAAEKVGGGEDTFYRSKLETARFYYDKILPETAALFTSLYAGGKSVHGFSNECFGPF
ncbi:MAG: acyl-CoA dehydrogenase C-terminal domain-containing protein [Holosporales bacterium]